MVVASNSFVNYSELKGGKRSRKSSRKVRKSTRKVRKSARKLSRSVRRSARKLSRSVRKSSSKKRKCKKTGKSVCRCKKGGYIRSGSVQHFLKAKGSQA